jgi:hypothetical protein
MFKTTFCYAELDFLKSMHKSDIVEIDIEHSWTESYAKMQLLAHGIPFTLKHPARLSRYTEDRAGIMSAPGPSTLILIVATDFSRPFYSFLRVSQVPIKP